MISCLPRTFERTTLLLKCYRLFTVLGGIFILTAFAGCQIVNIDANIINSDKYESEWIYGGIISPNQAETTISSIKDKEKYQTIAIIAPTTYKEDDHKIFTYSAPGILSKYGLKIDEKTVEIMTGTNVFHDLGQISENSFWNNEAVKQLAVNFPQAKFIFVSVNKEVSSAGMVGYALKSNLPDESTLFAIADYSENNPSNLIKSFQDDFTQEIISNFDETRFKELPVKDSIALEVLGRYLRLKGAHKSELLPNNQAIFKEEQYSPPKGDSTVYIVAFGDIMLGRYVRTLMDANELDYPFKKMDNSYLRVNDLLLANLEGPITKNAVKTSTGMNFGFFPDTAELLKKYHFDILSQANNHAFDKRKVGYKESFKLLQAQGIIPFGNTYELTDASVGKTYIRGQKIAFLGLEDVNSKIEDEKAIQKIKDLVKEEYRVIVFPHWGVEYVHQPNKRQKDLAHAFIDAGAYAVIGHHPHVVQTYENYKGRPIIYSLGNAVFDQYWSAPTQEGLSLAIAMSDKKIEISLLPITLTRSQMQLMSKDESAKFLAKFISWGEYSDDEKKMIKNGKITLTF